MITIGILAIQGAYQLHANKLTQLGVRWQYVRNSAELAAIQGLIIPGGESSVLLKLIQESNLLADLQSFVYPIFGTCAGAILLAKKVNSPTQFSFNHIDMTVERNAYGRQLASRIVTGHCHLSPSALPLEMVFIRAPRIRHCNTDVISILADYNHEPVAVQQGCYLASCFHPELTADIRLHQHFIALVAAELEQKLA